MCLSTHALPRVYRTRRRKQLCNAGSKPLHSNCFAVLLPAKSGLSYFSKADVRGVGIRLFSLGRLYEMNLKESPFEQWRTKSMKGKVYWHTKPDIKVVAYTAYER